MKLNWFKRNGIIFLPISIIGWIILLIGFVYSIYTFIDIDSRSHSVSDTLINFVFRLLIVIAVYSLIAYLTSRSSEK
jgi:membrane protein DedA with SNARE-associated domain